MCCCCKNITLHYIRSTFQIFQQTAYKILNHTKINKYLARNIMLSSSFSHCGWYSEAVHTFWDLLQLSLELFNLLIMPCYQKVPGTHVFLLLRTCYFNMKMLNTHNCIMNYLLLQHDLPETKLKHAIFISLSLCV